MKELGGDISALRARADELRGQGQTVMFAAVNGVVAGLIAVADPIKPTAKEAIAALHREGLRVVMLTGDNRLTAEAVARQIGIDQVEADVLPRPEGRRPSGIFRSSDSASPWPAMASTTRPRLPRPTSASPWAPAPTSRWRAPASRSSRATCAASSAPGASAEKTMKNIRQNLFFAFVYNMLGVPIAAGVLYPVVGLLLSPMIASAAMTFSSVSVIAQRAEAPPRRARRESSRT